MYMARGQYGAQARYRSVDLASRIESASPHRLVGIMFEELMKSLEAMAVAARKGDFSQRGSSQARALSVLHGLETSLDFDHGGEIAEGLAAIYREARRLVLSAGRDGGAEQAIQARDLISEIASAWEEIGNR